MHGFRPCLRFLSLGVAMMLGACASIVEGTSQNVTINTDPVGATCKLDQGGAQVAVVNPTPSSVRLDKSKENVSIVCEKPGHQTGAATLASEFQGMTFGNILFGGIVGVAIDAGSGAMHQYQPEVTIVLPPEKFASAADRDAFFDRQKARVTDDASKKTAAVMMNCAKDEPSQNACQARVKEIEAARDEQIGRFETQRLASAIGG